MTGDFDVDQKSQLCGVVDGKLPKEIADEAASKQAFSFANSFQTSNAKSNCKGDVCDDQGVDIGGSFCRQGLGDHLISQNRLSANCLYRNDQPTNSAIPDTIESNIDSLKTLTLKPDSTSTAFQSLNSGGTKSRDMTFSAAPVDENTFIFERSQSTQKFDTSNFFGDAVNVNFSGKSHSTPESSSGIESAYSSANPRSQLLQDTENLASTNENHLASSNSYWNAAGSVQAEDLNSQPTLALNNLSPLLTNLLFQQPNSPSASTNNATQSSSGNVSTLVAKRSVISGHQSMRPSLSRPPGWNPSTTSFDSSLTSSDQSPFFTPSNNLASSKAGWMGHLSSQNSGVYPWTSATSQSSSFKSTFPDTVYGLSSGNNGGGLRFGMNNTPSNMGSAGFPKGSSSSNSASIYSMFPKRSSHRVMAHWQQQHMQQGSPSMVGKQHSSDFSGSGPLSVGGQDSLINQKISHGSFGSLGLNSSASPLSNSLMSSNIDGANIEKYSNYSFDQHLIELMRSIDVGNPQTGMIDEFAAGMDNYHGNFHSFSNMSQSRVGLMPGGLQSQSLHGMSSVHSNLSAIAPREEGYSRKVFVGGLPPDIDEGMVFLFFCIFALTC